jgi:hypothetical protein
VNRGGEEVLLELEARYDSNVTVGEPEVAVVEPPEHVPVGALEYYPIDGTHARSEAIEQAKCVEDAETVRLDCDPAAHPAKVLGLLEYGWSEAELSRSERGRQPSRSGADYPNAHEAWAP